MGKDFFKRMLFGEQMPDKDDPKYQKRYENEVAAGRRFAKFACLDKAAANIQRFALDHTKVFLVMVFGFIGLSFSMNIARMAIVYNNHTQYKTATEKQDSLMKKRGMTTFNDHVNRNDSIN